MTHTMLAPIAGASGLEVEVELLPNNDENEGSTNLTTLGFVFRINAFPDFAQISLSNRRQSIYPSGRQRYP